MIFEDGFGFGLRAKIRENRRGNENRKEVSEREGGENGMQIEVAILIWGGVCSRFAWAHHTSLLN